jgi:hypothetical protein
MRQVGIIIGKWKMRGIRRLEILGLDEGHTRAGVYMAMTSAEDRIGRRSAVSRCRSTPPIDIPGSGGMITLDLFPGCDEALHANCNRTSSGALGGNAAA